MPTLQRALLVSVLLHAALLALWRTPSIPTNTPAPLDLRLWIEDPGPQHHDSPNSADVRRPAESRAQPMAASAVPEAQPSEPSPMDDAVRAEEPGAASPAEVEDVPAMVASTSDAVPVESASALQPAEETQLARRIESWSRSFNDLRKAAQPRVWRRDGREYVARVERQPASGPMDLDHVEVVVTTEQEGQLLETRMRMKRLAFSHFTQLVDRWDVTMQMHDDEIHGRFHSNAEMVIGATREVAPRFHGLVTTAAGGYKVATPDNVPRKREVFLGGIDKNAGYIDLPRVGVPLGDSEPEQALARRFFDEDTEIEFLSEGGYRWRPQGSNGGWQRDDMGVQPLYLLARPRVILDIRGKLRGTVLVYSPYRIRIAGSLLYARDVRGRADVDDYLGIASDGDVVIAPPEITGPGDLVIEAAIYARGRFAVPDLYAEPAATLRVYGSVTAGMFSASEPRYATRIEFDRRFERLRPPAFPQTNRYELDNWDRRWRAVSSAD